MRKTEAQVNKTKVRKLTEELVELKGQIVVQSDYILDIEKLEEEGLKEVVLQTAKICHEVNRAFCVSIGDNSQPSWDKAPEWQKKSAISGVYFHRLNPDSKPSDSHENWLKDKKADGWVYGEVKNVKKKEHPCMVAYEDLDANQKTKDALFISVVQSFID